MNLTTMIIQKTVSLLSITFINHFLLIVWCLVTCLVPRNQLANSLNYNLADKTCEFNNDRKYFRPKHFVEKPTYVYADNPDSGAFLFHFGSILFFIISENNSYFWYFVLCAPFFFFFFLTSRILMNCELSSRKKKRINKYLLV